MSRASQKTNNHSSDDESQSRSRCTRSTSRSAPYNRTKSRESSSITINKRRERIQPKEQITYSNNNSGYHPNSSTGQLTPDKYDYSSQYCNSNNIISQKKEHEYAELSKKKNQIINQLKEQVKDLDDKLDVSVWIFKYIRLLKYIMCGFK